MNALKIIAILQVTVGLILLAMLVAARGEWPDGTGGLLLAALILGFARMHLQYRAGERARKR